MRCSKAGMVLYRDCFTPLISTKFRQALEPHINHVATGSRRGALKSSGDLLIGFSGGLGSSVLLDLVHKVYCTSVGGDASKGGREHPRRNRVWKKIHVCYVEMCDAFPEARQPTSPLSLFGPHVECARQANGLRGSAKLSLGTRVTSSRQYVSKTPSTAAGGKEFLAA